MYEYIFKHSMIFAKPQTTFFRNSLPLVKPRTDFHLIKFPTSTRCRLKRTFFEFLRQRRVELLGEAQPRWCCSFFSSFVTRWAPTNFKWNYKPQ